MDQNSNSPERRADQDKQQGPSPTLPTSGRQKTKPEEGTLLLQPGAEIVPGYTLVRVLGEGGFGVVWEAQAPGQFPVALKFVWLGSSAARPELRSLEILRTIRHPHLLDIQWAVEKGDRLVIAMPLCDHSLHDRLNECVAQGLPGIPRPELLGYMNEVARALDFLNEPRHLTPEGGRVRVQHRDIKPRNIFLVGGSARVADFGLAKILDESVVVHSGSMTPYYAPPEFFNDQVASTSDQWSLAVTYYQLLCNRLPFTGSYRRVLKGILEEEPNLDGLPAEERPIVRRALSRQPHQRWSSCQEFVGHLTRGRAPAVAPRAQWLQALAREVRAKTLQVLGAARVGELTWTPPGTSNHILWHAGHALWVQDALCVQLLVGKSELPADWEPMFRMGSRPFLQKQPWPSRDTLQRQLHNQLPRLLELIGSIRDADLDALPPYPHGSDTRTLGECILHGLHDEANHQGEMYLLLKAQRLRRTATEPDA